MWGEVTNVNAFMLTDNDLHFTKRRLLFLNPLLCHFISPCLLTFTAKSSDSPQNQSPDTHQDTNTQRAYVLSLYAVCGTMKRELQSKYP